MKKISKLFAVAFLCLCLVACATAPAVTEIWENATYTADTDLGTGAVTVQVEVVAEDKSVTFTLHTDKAILGDALLEHGLIAGDMGDYGLYVKTVNGILADYDVNQTYWALSQNGETLMTGVDGVTVEDGAHYELIRTK